MATTDQLLMPFVRGIYALVCALRQVTLTPSQERRMLEGISDDIKKCTNFFAPGVSRQAREHARQLNIDLSFKYWRDQPRFDKGRKIFHWEHMDPVSSIRLACLEQASESGILEVLKNRLRAVWILKSEDEKLTRLGYRSKRPPDAYSKAGIELVTESPC